MMRAGAGPLSDSGPVYLNNFHMAIGEASLAFAAYQLREFQKSFL
jgi:hypothetical protein